MTVFLGLAEVERWFARRDGDSGEKRVFLLAGQDSVAIRELTARLTSRFAPNSAMRLGSAEIDAAAAPPAMIVDLLREVPLFAEQRSIVIENAEKLLNDTHFPNIIERIFAPDDPTLIVLQMTQPARTIESKPLVKECVKRGAAAYFYAPRDEAEAIRWTRRYSAGRGVEMTEDAARLLVSMAGTNIGEIAQEIGKLSYVASGVSGDGTSRAKRSITAELVEEYVSPHRESVPFEWADAVLERDPRAVEKSAVTTDYGRLAIPAIAALNTRFADIERWRNNEPIAPFRRAAVQRLARKWREVDLARARRILLDLDIDLKSRPAVTHLARVELATVKLLESGAS